MTTSGNHIPKFKIKLLSGQNVVLVDCPGYESELFMPQIMDERIIFRNIIPNRSCCSAAEYPTPLIFKSLTEQADGNVCLPKSSVPVVSTKVPPRVIGGKENGIGSTKVQQLSPQMIRYQLNEQANELRVHLLPLYKTENKNFPKPNFEGLISQLSTPPDITDPKKTSKSSTKSATPTTNVQNHSGYNLPITPTPDNRESLKSGHTQSLNNNRSPNENFLKCLTPVHTYSLSRNSSSTVSSSTTSGLTAKTAFNISPGKNKFKRATKPPHPNLKLNNVHRRKLIIDKKISLTADEMKQTDYQIMVKKKIKKLASAKNRKQLDTNKLTAFEVRVLTAPSPSFVSNKLKKQFRNALCKKSSSTHPVYKQVTEPPLIRIDKQVQQVQRKYKHKKITRPATTTTQTAATATSAELATEAAASASVAASSKAMEIIGKPITITRTSPSPAKYFGLAKAQSATLSKQ